MDQLILQGAGFHRAGQMTAAVEAYRMALALAPGNATACRGLADALRQLGRSADAEQLYTLALQLSPTLDTYNHLVSLLQELGRFDDAVDRYHGALELPQVQDWVHSNLATLLADQGKSEAAQRYFESAIAIKADFKDVISLATILPVVYRSVEDIDRWRDEFTHNVQALIERSITIDPTKEPLPTLFRLCYQGRNDVSLNTSVNRLFVPEPNPSRQLRLLETKPPRDRVRVGFISSFFRDHTVGDLMKGFVAELRRDQFEVTVISVGSWRGAAADAFRQQADRYVTVGSDIQRAMETIDSLSCDVLFYGDIGMHPVTSALACSRLAPVQCVTWGHPVTTGMNTIDYFISSEMLETADADEHYSEQLVRLKNLPTYYHRLSVPPERVDREQLGLPTTKRLYGCLQSIFKIHPEFDAILGEILQRDPDGILLLVEGHYRSWAEQLLARFAKSIPEVLHQIQVVPRRSRSEFLNLVSALDVMLDPIHFGSGNTAYQSLALGVPLVTWPSQLMRGRVVNACYQKIGVMDCVAETGQQYVELALNVATDSEFRRDVGQRISRRCDLLFEDSAAVRELEEFLISAVSGKPASSLSVTKREAKREANREANREGSRGVV